MGRRVIGRGIRGLRRSRDKPINGTNRGPHRSRSPADHADRYVDRLPGRALVRGLGEGEEEPADADPPEHLGYPRRAPPPVLLGSGSSTVLSRLASRRSTGEDAVVPVPVKLAKSYLPRDRGLVADYGLGLRAWGLVLYGSMPASLAALGVGKLQQLELASSEPLVQAAAVVVVSIPLVVVLLLIQQRLDAWYLGRDLRILRGFSVTLVVFLAAGVLTGAAQVFTDGRPAPEQMLLAVANAFLVGALTLSVSSALFMIAIKSDSGLPLLPSAAFTKDLAQLRTVFYAIRRSGFWNKDDRALDELGKHIASARETLDSLVRGAGAGKASLRLYARLIEDLDSLDYARTQAEEASVRFSDFLDPSPVLGASDRKHRDGIDRLRLSLGVGA